MISERDVASAVDTLALVYTRRLTASDRDALVKLWHLTLRDVTRAELEAAVLERMKRTDSYFPTPGQVLGLVLARREAEAVQRYRERPPDPDPEPVPPGTFRKLLAEQGITLPEPRDIE